MPSAYAHPEYLVDTAWVAGHLNDPAVRIVESDEDFLLYDSGHIPNAAKVDWFTTLQHPVRRDFLSKADFEKLCSELGIKNDTTVVFYGDKSNWFATLCPVAVPVLRARERQDHEWRAHEMGAGKTTSQQRRPCFPRNGLQSQGPGPQAAAPSASRSSSTSPRKKPLVDVRSPKEYSGELLHMPNYPQEGATRGGHIPGAVNIPWSQAVNEADSTFKTAEELRSLYEGKGITPDEEVIAYCRIGERSSHTWFVLTYLLGYPNVKNYDGSWTEWGNLVNAPIEK